MSALLFKNVDDSSGVWLSSFFRELCCAEAEIVFFCLFVFFSWTFYCTTLKPLFLEFPESSRKCKKSAFTVTNTQVAFSRPQWREAESQVTPSILRCSACICRNYTNPQQPPCAHGDEFKQFSNAAQLKGSFRTKNIEHSKLWCESVHREKPRWLHSNGGSQLSFCKGSAAHHELCTQWNNGAAPGFQPELQVVWRSGSDQNDPANGNISCLQISNAARRW